MSEHCQPRMKLIADESLTQVQQALSIEKKIAQDFGTVQEKHCRKDYKFP